MFEQNDTNNLTSLRCDEFILALASKAPVPGGGGASALVGAIGMALGSMVANLTLGKKKYAHVESEIQALLVRSSALIDQLMSLVTQDAEAFYPLSQSYGLPQGTESEKLARDIATQEALVFATQVPLSISKACLEAIQLHRDYAKIGSRIAISDIGVGVILCKAALQGAALNVLINTKMMQNAVLKADIELQLEMSVSEGSILADRIYNEIESMLR